MRKTLLQALAPSLVVSAFLFSGCGDTTTDTETILNQEQAHEVKITKGLFNFLLPDEDIWHTAVNVTSTYNKSDKSININALCKKGISSDVSTYQVYINTDNKFYTGFSTGIFSWDVIGADYLIDDDALFKSTSKTNWEWEWVQDIDFSTSGSTTSNYNLNYKLNSDAVQAIFGDNIPSKIGISIEPVGDDWSDTGNYVSPRHVRINVSDAPHRPDMALIPHDANVEVGNEPNIFYMADSYPETNGLNRVIRVDMNDLNDLTYTSLYTNGDNPHSVDRAGDSSYFFIRTQNSKSFDVMNFQDDTVETVSLIDHKPRSIGATNLKYDIQLLTGKDMPVTDIIDINTHQVITTLGDRHNYDPATITSNGGTAASGHALWIDEDNFLMIDRVNKELITYHISKNQNGTLKFEKKSVIETDTTMHIVEKMLTNQKVDRDYNIMYAMAEGDYTKGIAPSVIELTFNPTTGILAKTGRKVVFSNSNKVIQNVKPTAHHGAVDSKYFYATILTGEVYIIDRTTMQIVSELEAKLGAGHIDFSDKHNLAIVTNHFSNFITVIDRDTLVVVKNIKIGFTHQHDANNKLIMQPHHGIFTADGDYFVNFSTQDGKMFMLNLETLEIDQTLYVGGAPEQSHS